jgi:hypothetical protein
MEVLFKVLLQIELLEQLLLFIEAMLVVDHVQVVAQLFPYLVRLHLPSPSIEGPPLG